MANQGEFIQMNERLLDEVSVNRHTHSNPGQQAQHAYAFNSADSSRGWLQAIIDSSHLIMFCISISVIIYGSFRSLNIDKENHEQEMLNEKNNESGDASEPKSCGDEENMQQTVQTIDSAQALFIPIAASISLLLMFFFFDSIQTAFLICTSILAIVTFAFLLLPVCSFLFKSLCSNSRSLKKISCGVLGKFSLPELTSIFLASCIVGLWILTGHWLLMDIIGVGFCITFIAIVRLPSLKVSTLLLVGLVVYDVFWVYFSHLIFDSNVMVKVATKEADNPVGVMARKFNIETSFSKESPKLSLPGKLVVPSYKRSGNFSILGLGDIVVPGLLLCFVLRFDAFKRSQLYQSIVPNPPTSTTNADATDEKKPFHKQPHKINCTCYECDLPSSRVKSKQNYYQRHNSFPSLTAPFGYFNSLASQKNHSPAHNYSFKNLIRLNRLSYFHCSLVGYFVGLITATLSSEIFREAQPALLFLVPFTLLPLLTMAYIKGDLHLMWNEPFSYSNTKYFYV